MRVFAFLGMWMFFSVVSFALMCVELFAEIAASNDLSAGAVAPWAIFFIFPWLAALEGLACTALALLIRYLFRRILESRQHAFETTDL